MHAGAKDIAQVQGIGTSRATCIGKLAQHQQRGGLLGHRRLVGGVDEGKHGLRDVFRGIRQVHAKGDGRIQQRAFKMDQAFHVHIVPGRRRVDLDAQA